MRRRRYGRPALQVNKTLRSLVWDGNGASVAAFTTLSLALARNPALQLLSLPLENLTQCYQGCIPPVVRP